MKKVIIGIVSVVSIVFVALFISTGGARTDVHLRNYQVSEDDKTMTITVNLASSAGYIRDMKQKNDNGDYYLTFYSTFGINSKLGAKDTFTLEIDSNVDAIYFYAGENNYKQVLQKDEITGEWHTVTKDANNNEVTEKFELIEYDFLMKGKNNTSLFIDSVNSNEYDELTKILYPNGIVDEQGQEIGIIENATEVRKNFIDEHTKAYTVINGATKEVELEHFYIDLKEMSNELYFDSIGGDSRYLCYKATVDEDVFVFPSEWGNQPFGFIEASEDSSYYTFTNWGIWKIDTEKLSLDKFTSDKHEGKTYMEIMNEISNDNTAYNEGSLCWIDSAQISPNNNYIVYRSNRGSEDLSETSVWKLDLKTRVEEKVLIEDLYNDIVGFVSDDVIVVGSTRNTRLVNLSNLNVQKIEIPPESNMCVMGVKNGKLFYTTYENGSEQTTTVLNELNLETGKLTELQRYPLRYSNLTENIEGIAFDDLLCLQNAVDNGHYTWRLKPEDVVREYWYTLYGINNGEILNIESTDLNKAIVYYTLDNQTYELLLVQPIKKGNTGIWLVRSCKNYVKEFENFSVPDEEKINNIIVEGMTEEVNYKGIKSSLGYTIQYNDESLNLTRENKKDIYRANIDDIKDKVYFAVEYLEKSYDELKIENKENNIEEAEINGQKTFKVIFIDDVLFDEKNNTTWKWDSDVKTLWYIDANNGTYLIEEHYFFEATEGWGVRINQMLNTFKIIEK